MRNDLSTINKGNKGEGVLGMNIDVADEESLERVK